MMHGQTNIKSNELFENVAKFKYFGTNLKIKNYIHEEIKSRLISVNAPCHSAQNISSELCFPKK
jgi:hypothetical protein